MVPRAGMRGKRQPPLLPPPHARPSLSVAPKAAAAGDCFRFPSRGMLSRCRLCRVGGDSSTPPNLLPRAGVPLTHPLLDYC